MESLTVEEKVLEQSVIPVERDPVRKSVLRRHGAWIGLTTILALDLIALGICGGIVHDWRSFSGGNRIRRASELETYGFNEEDAKIISKQELMPWSSVIKKFSLKGFEHPLKGLVSPNPKDPESAIFGVIYEGSPDHGVRFGAALRIRFHEMLKTTMGYKYTSEKYRVAVSELKKGKISTDLEVFSRRVGVLASESFARAERRLNQVKKMCLCQWISEMSRQIFYELGYTKFADINFLFAPVEARMLLAAAYVFAVLRVRGIRASEGCKMAGIRSR